MFYEKHWFGNQESYDIYPLENVTFPFHFHRSFEMVFLLEGSLTVHVENTPYRMASQDVAFLFPNQVHSLVAEGPYKCMIFIFAPELVGQFFSRYGKCIPACNVFSYRPLTQTAFQFRNYYQLKSFLYQMCGELLEHTDFKSLDKKNSQFLLLHQILTYIEEHINETCTLLQAAAALEYEYTYLSRFFAETMDMTYTAYLNQYRINRACYLLRNGGDTVADIAMQCGYDTIRTFNRNFKRLTGMSPAAYRIDSRHMPSDRNSFSAIPIGAKKTIYLPFSF